jgi:hypothetical protein
MDETKYESLVNTLGEMCVISASKKFGEVMMATFDEWASSEPRFSYDFEASDIVAKSSFMNESFSYFSAVQGNVRNMKNPLAEPESRQVLAKNGVGLNTWLEQMLHSISKVDSEEGMLQLKEKLAWKIMDHYFPHSSREKFQIHADIVDQLDYWVSCIVAEVISSSHFGLGSPADSEFALFYRFVKDKDEHVVASILIGIAYIEFWLSSESDRHNIGDGRIDDGD